VVYFVERHGLVGFWFGLGCLWYDELEVESLGGWMNTRWRCRGKFDAGELFLYRMRFVDWLGEEV
jgi:hypothetical protein